MLGGSILLHLQFSGLSPLQTSLPELILHYLGILLRYVTFVLAVYMFGRLFAKRRSSFTFLSVASCICLSSVADYLLILAIIWPQYPPIYRTALNLYVLFSQLVGLQGMSARTSHVRLRSNCADIQLPQPSLLNPQRFASYSLHTRMHCDGHSRCCHERASTVR